MAKCKACGAPIEFIRTPAGNHMPVDPRPLYIEKDPEGNEVLITAGGEVVRCFITEQGAVYDPRKVAYRSHFASCPEGEKTKRAKAAAAAKEREEQEAQGQQLSFMGGRPTWDGGR